MNPGVERRSSFPAKYLINTLVYVKRDNGEYIPYFIDYSTGTMGGANFPPGFIFNNLINIFSGTNILDINSVLLLKIECWRHRKSANRTYCTLFISLNF